MRNNFNLRINQQITAASVRVIGATGKQLGIMPLREALDNASKEKLDLVEIASKAKPPVVKIVELGKFKYEQEKKLRKQQKKSKGGEIKEIRFSPFIGNADFNTRLIKIKEFLGDNNKIRVVVKFKGRQMGSKQFGYNVLDKLLAALDTEVNVDMKPKFLGRHLTMVISPLSKSKKAGDQESKNKK